MLHRKPEKLIRLRLERGMSQTEFGRVIGTTASQLCAWERGRARVPELRWARILIALAMPYEPLFDTEPVSAATFEEELDE